MPLVPDAERLIRGCFAALRRGEKPRRVTIGYLTQQQVEDINAERKLRNFVPLSGELFFVGRHIYERRVLDDGYTEDDVITMMRMAAAETCCFIQTRKMTVLQSQNHRPSGYGCMVRDELTLECSRSPLAEVYSVVPRGDMHHKPKKLKEATMEMASEELTNSPG